MLVCGKRAIANGKLVWKNLPITTSQNPQESRIKLFQKEFGILDPHQILYKFAIYAFEVKHEQKFECGFVSFNEVPLHCQIAFMVTLDDGAGKVIFEKNCLLKSFLGCHYFSFKKDHNLSDKTFQTSLVIQFSAEEETTESVCAHLRRSFHSGECSSSSDLKIHCQEKIFYVHRFILDMHCDLLKVLNGSGSVAISGYSPVVVESLLRFFYYDCIAIEEIDENLMLIAHQYNAKKLFLLCERFLAETLHSLDITKTLSAASKCGSKTILKSGIHWILQHKNDVNVRSSWNDFCDENPKVCIETTKMIDQIFENDIDRYEIVTCQNISMYRFKGIPKMIELNVGYLASSPRVLATMQNMRMTGE